MSARYSRATLLDYSSYSQSLLSLINTMKSADAPENPLEPATLTPNLDALQNAYLRHLQSSENAPSKPLDVTEPTDAPKADDSSNIADSSASAVATPTAPPSASASNLLIELYPAGESTGNDILPVVEWSPLQPNDLAGTLFGMYRTFRPFPPSSFL